MIVFDLRCGGNHVFDAWFGSSDAYADQRERGLIECPVCGDHAIEKAAMAPAVATKGNRQGAAPPTSAAANLPAPAELKAALGRLAQVQAKMLEGSEWVGRSFAARARSMHQGEEDHAPIHGQATPAEATALAREGVSVAPLPLPIVPPERVN